MVQLHGPRTRVAGESAMCAVVDAQRDAPPRGMLARVLGFSPLTRAARASYRDALGEIIVGDRLDGLGRHWDVLHDIPHPGGMLDHLVIGPGGVFTVRTLNADGAEVVVDGDALRVGGAPSDEVLAARADARAAERLLTAAARSRVAVRPILVIVQAARLLRRASPDAVRVVAADHLATAITSAPRTLDGAAVARVSDLADRAATWGAGTEAGSEGVHREFSVVRESVRRAALVRTVWGGVAFALLCVLTWALTASIITSAVATG